MESRGARGAEVNACIGIAEEEIPEVLTSGHHKRVAQWRREKAEELTRLRRPDLWSTYEQASKKKVEDR